MNKEQILRYFTEGNNIKVSEQLFKELGLEGENRFDIERICRGFNTVDLYHFDSGEVVHDVESIDLFVL